MFIWNKYYKRYSSKLFLLPLTLLHSVWARVKYVGWYFLCGFQRVFSLLCPVYTLDGGLYFKSDVVSFVTRAELYLVITLWMDHPQEEQLCSVLLSDQSLQVSSLFGCHLADLLVKTAKISENCCFGENQQNCKKTWQFFAGA